MDSQWQKSLRQLTNSFPSVNDQLFFSVDCWTGRDFPFRGTKIVEAYTNEKSSLSVDVVWIWFKLCNFKQIVVQLSSNLLAHPNTHIYAHRWKRDCFLWLWLYMYMCEFMWLPTSDCSFGENISLLNFIIIITAKWFLIVSGWGSSAICICCKGWPN